MGFEADTLDDYLMRAHKQAQYATQARARAISAIYTAHFNGATNEQIAEATGLSVRAVDAYIRKHERDMNRPPGTVERETVGLPPPRRRTRNDAPRWR